MQDVLNLYNVSKEMLGKAKAKYPERIYEVNTTRWHEDPDEIMTGVFKFLGLEWQTQYLTMEVINAKRAAGSVRTVPFSKGKNEDVSIVYIGD